MAAPAVPVAGPAVISLGALMLWLGVLGLLLAYRATLGAILLGFANLIDDIAVSVRFATIRPFGAFAEALRDVDGFIRGNLGKAARSLEDGVAYFFDKTWTTVREIGGFQERFSETVAGAFTDLHRRTIPAAERRAKEQARRDVAPVATKVASVTTVALPGIRADVGEVAGHIGRIDDALRGVRDRVRAHERLLVGAGLTALAIRMLGRLKLGWLRCTKVGRVGRATCGMDADFLSSVLALTTAMLGTYSLVQFAEEMQDVTEEVAPLIQRFWRAT